MYLKDLKSEAQKRGIKKFYEMNKKQLLEALGYKSISSDVWSIIIQYMSIYQRVNVYLTCKEIYEKTKCTTIYDKIKLNPLYNTEIKENNIIKIAKSLKIKKYKDMPYEQLKNKIKSKICPPDYQINNFFCIKNTILSDFLNIKHLELETKNINELLIPPNIEYLKLSGCNQGSLLIHCNIKEIFFERCNIKFPIFKEGIKKITARYCSLKQIHVPESVTYLDLYYNNITDIQEHPNLEFLDISCNLITKIPKLPKVKKIIAHSNKIKKISSLPLVKELNVRGNDIQTVEDLPNIEILTIDENYNLKNLKIQPSLKRLQCDSNILFPNKKGTAWISFF